jgi:Na+/H+ antiporter NhaA
VRAGRAEAGSPAEPRLGAGDKVSGDEPRRYGDLNRATPRRPTPMTTSTQPPFSARTAWSRSVRTPLRAFLATETGGAAVLLAAAVAALAWANLDASAYERFWETTLSFELGDHGISLSLREWVNSGLMALFFFVVGLEARREFDLGELRERRRFVLPLLAASGGIGFSIAAYLAVNAGRSSAHGWGVVLATDTAFALGVLAIAGPRLSDRLRAFMLTVVVADDILAIAVIATVYTDEVTASAFLLGIALFAIVVAAARLRIRSSLLYVVLGVATWAAVEESGVDPIIVGLAMGLLAYASAPERSTLERVTERFREFREQPTPELARSVRDDVRRAISPNERLQQFWHPWTSYVIVPLFALANAGVALDRELLADALTSPITLGIALGYVVARPLGFVGVTWLSTRLTGGRVRPPVGWAAVAGGGLVAGIGFTVSLLIATLAFDGRVLAEAKVGILGAAVAASLLTWLLFRATRLLPARVRTRALVGSDEPITDLYIEVDGDRDHMRGPRDAPVTVVEYGDFECPYCGQAEPVVRELLSDFADVRYVWRHLPLTDVHVHAQLAAEAAEAAADQGAFWPMHDLLLTNQDALEIDDLIEYATRLGLDVERFTNDLHGHVGAARVAEDVDSADLSTVSGTPTFFVNGRRHYGAYDITTLSDAVRAAGARALVSSPP